MLAKKIKEGGIGILPTDTVYGLVCSALKKDSVEKMYELKKRDTSKPFVYLISKTEDLEILGIQTNIDLQKYWPGPTSIILEGKNIPEYMHRGHGSIAVRLPDQKELLEILSETGPLATTSANLEGMPPATTVEEARDYFGDKLDFYIDAGHLSATSSTILKVSSKGVEVIRSTLTTNLPKEAINN